MSPLKQLFSVGALMGSGALLAPPARAYCRATTCDPADPKQRCQRDPVSKCPITGEPLRWASDCLTISVQSDGAPKAGIDYESAEASVRRAFAAWTSVDCDGQAPSLRVGISEPVSCDASEYSSERHNANIVMFREKEWPYVGAEDALGLTRVRFDLDDVAGELWDADIEVNAVAEPLSTGQPKLDEVDLDSLLTHEAGHVLGLAHTLEIGATMAAGYAPGSTALRTPAADDVTGICAIYPPGRKASSSSCEPRHGFSELCIGDQPLEPVPTPDLGASADDGAGSSSCSLAKARGEGSMSLPLAMAAAWLLRCWPRSSRKRHQLVPCRGPGLRR